jgi:hypothetical protein
MTQQPKNSQAAAVGQMLKSPRKAHKIANVGHILSHKRAVRAVVVWQMNVRHTNNLLIIG